VSDKGLPAALYMGLARSLIHSEVKRGSSPRQALLNTNRLLLEMSQAEMFVTVFCAVLDAAQGTLRYARAGHDLPFLVRPGTSESQSLTAQGTALGISEHIQLEEAEVKLHPNDMLVLYTDGITDANSPQGEFFGAERLRTAICSAADVGAQELCDSVFEQVAAFQNESVQYDDMAVLAVKWMGT